LRRGATGRYATTTYAGERVRAFIPEPLPPQRAVILDGARLERALLSLGRLDSVTTLLPDPHLFLYSYVRKEAVLSSQIEGTQSSLSELLLFELAEAPGIPGDDVTEVSNYVAALDYGLRRARSTLPLSSRLLREIHERLLKSGRGSAKEPGQFRRSQNWIDGSRPGNAHFVPPPPNEVAECMGALERFLHDEQSPMPVLMKAALAHVQFETIHPFLDGNGRVGRLLVTLVLCNGGVLKEPLLYLSLYLKQHRDEYYRLLDLVRTEGDWEAWLDFFLDGVHTTANEAVAAAQRLVVLFTEDRARIQARGGLSAGSALRVHDTIKMRPVRSLKTVCDASGLSFPGASSGMAVLMELGIVSEMTGLRRNRVFGYNRYVEILSEGTEPL
jgi:Fic family protein